MKKLIFPALSVIGAIIVIYLVTHRLTKKKYESFLQTLGFGEVILDQMSLKELKAVYIYINDYTRKGRTVPEGSELDKTLLKVAHKYEIINYI